MGWDMAERGLPLGGEAAAHMKQKHRLLLVEDSVDDQFMVKRALRDVPDLVIEVASNGQEAVDFLFAHEADPPGLVLLDLKMPQMSGNEALCVIREKETFTELPIVIFTSSIEPADIEEARRCNATDYVQKPVGFAPYNTLVRDIVRRYMGV